VFDPSICPKRYVPDKVVEGSKLARPTKWFPLSSFRRPLASFKQEEYQILRVDGLIEGGVNSVDWRARKRVEGKLNQIE
jgi:hypothetical protein